MSPDFWLCVLFVFAVKMLHPNDKKNYHQVKGARVKQVSYRSGQIKSSYPQATFPMSKSAGREEVSKIFEFECEYLVDFSKK